MESVIEERGHSKQSDIFYFIFVMHDKNQKLKQIINWNQELGSPLNFNITFEAEDLDTGDGDLLGHGGNEDSQGRV